MRIVERLKVVANNGPDQRADGANHDHDEELEPNAVGRGEDCGEAA